MASRRRTIGGFAALALVVLAGAYEWWRLSEMSREGWAGFTYLPAITEKTKGKKPIDYGFGGFIAGSVMYVHPGSAADRAQIARGDVVRSINGIALTDNPAIERLNAAVRHGDVLTYRIAHDKRESLRQVRLGSPLDSTLFVASYALGQNIALIFLGIGIFVFWRLPNDPRALVFYVMTLLGALAASSATMIQVEAQNLRGVVSAVPETGRFLHLVLFGVLSFFFAPLLLHLALVFPKERPVVARRGRALFTWIYAPPVYGSVIALGAILLTAIPRYEQVLTGFSLKLGFWIFAACVASIGGISLYRLGATARRTSLREALITKPLAVLNVVVTLLTGFSIVLGLIVDRTHSPAAFYVGMGIVMLSCFLAVSLYPISTFVCLYRSYREANAEERRQVKWPLWGTMVAVGGRIAIGVIGLIVGSMIFLGKNSIPTIVIMVPDLLARTVYILIPISFAFAILKYRLMNIDVIIRRTVLYSILSAVVFVLYGILVVGVGTLLVRFAGVQNQTMVIASTIVVALVAVPLRNRLQGMVDRNLFREKRDYPQALREIADLIGRADIEAFLRRSAEIMQHATQTQFIVIALRSEKQFVASAKVGLADDVITQFRVPASSIDLARTLDARRDELPAELRRIGTAIVLPVSIHRDALGFIAAGAKLSHEAISEDDAAFLESAAAQIALSIENSRLRTEEAEFAQARAIQQVLLPTHFPKLDGFTISGKWQPARSVGGDYFDTLALGASKAAVCIADVAGKGMPAALLMANLQAAVKATAGAEVSPSQLCDKVKRVVVDNLGSKFISFFYGVLDASTRSFTFANAGHNPPIVARANGTIERLAAGGPVFGRLFLGDPHQEGRISIAPGDRIVLFTDGASEARRGDDELGEERLAELIASNRQLGAAALQEKIADEISAFSGGNLADDVTLVVIAAE